MTDLNEKAESAVLTSRAKTELKKDRDTWNDLPLYVYTDEYEAALLEWLDKHLANGRTDVETLILYALHHETAVRNPYFPFERS